MDEPLSGFDMLDFTNIREGSPQMDEVVLGGPSSSSEGSGSTASSDAASPASNASPGDYSAWNTGLGVDTSGGHAADDPWGWTKMDLETIASGAGQNAIATSLMDSSALNFDHLMLPMQPTHLLPPSASPMDILGLPDLLQTLSSFHQPFRSNTLDAFYPPQVIQQLQPIPTLHFPPNLPVQQVAQHHTSASDISSLYSGTSHLEVNLRPVPSTSELNDIAAKVRERAGVQVAISANNSHAISVSSDVPQKLPIPRLAKPVLSGRPPLAKHVRPSPVSSTSGDSPPSIAIPNQTDSSQFVIGASGRPKTSHTTIERRYRTNLNARITALKHAVPALRVLDKDQFPEDKIDERGYVDGVKAARKSSKASVLGKASEYIHVLKNREARLRREGQGLKALINSLVGGPALLREWEASWLEKYGGEEMDEAIQQSDCDDEDLSEDEEEKPRKKPRISKSATMVVKKDRPFPDTTKDAVGETGKRKRGRPKKGTETPTLSSPTSHTGISPVAPVHIGLQNHTVSHQADPTSDSSASPAKYLLGIFLFFSFFKSGPTPPGHMVHPHSHGGSVVMHPSGLEMKATPTISQLPLSNVAYHLHTTLSILLLISVLIPLVPKLKSRRWLWETQPVVFASTRSRPGILKVEDWSESRRDLGIRNIVWECAGLWLHSFGKVPMSDASDLHNKQWRRLVAVHLMKDELHGFGSKWSTVLGLYSRMPANPSASDIAALALAFHPVSRSISSRLWTRASSAAGLTDNEAICLRMQPDEARLLFNRATMYGPIDDQTQFLSVLMETLVLEAIKAISGSLFIKVVASIQPRFDSEDEESEDRELREAAEWVSAVLCGIEGPTRRLGLIWERVWDAFLAGRAVETGNADDDRDDPISIPSTNSIVQDIQHLINSLNLLSVVLPPKENHKIRVRSDSATPTPSWSSFQSRTSASTSLRLRQLLASSAFDGDEAVEEARDRLVDILSFDRLDNRARNLLLVH